METLILNSLKIRNFRGFQHLQIERLGRVNLIVGKNNVGKSNLLEALQMYARRASTSTIISEMSLFVVSIAKSFTHYGLKRLIA